MKASTRPSSFVAAVRVNRDEPHRSLTLSSDDDIDELDFDYWAGTSGNTKHAEMINAVPRSQLQSSGASQNPVQTPAQRSNTKRVAAVVSPRKPCSSKTTRTVKRKPQRNELVGNKHTTAKSVRSNAKKAPTRTQPVTSLPRTKQPRSFLHPVMPATVDDQVGSENAVQSLGSMSNQPLLDRGELGIQLLVLLESQNAGRHEIAHTQNTMERIKSIAVQYSEELKNALDNEYEKCKVALDRWLACMKTLVEFRKKTGLSGDGPSILAGFETLPLEKRKGQRPYLEMCRDVRTWVRDGMTIFVFCKEVGSILLKMASFAPLGMRLDDLLKVLIPFTAGLMGCFLSRPSNS